MKNDLILLVGSGPMAVEYARVLKDMGWKFIVVGRHKKSAENFEKTIGIRAELGGIDKWFENNKLIPKKALVVVSEDELGNVALCLLRHGVKEILVEKPGGLDFEQIRKVARESIAKKAKVFIGYNRRFYASVKKAREIIKQDGGVLSFNFEFTEWSNIVSKLKKGDGVLENWFLHNSSHVIDLVFYLGGKPKKISTFTSGGLSWHPKASIFSGAGVTDSKALFSYQANWEAPGRWGLEILTKKHRLIFRPLEKLQLQKLDSLTVEEVKIDDELDRKYKAGLYIQLNNFLNNKISDLCDIQEQAANLKIYERIISQ